MFNKTDPKTPSDEARSGNHGSSPTAIVRNQDAASIGPSTHISGDIRANEDLTVHGHVEGSIHLGDGLLIVTRGGQVDADVNARVINVEGRIEGNLWATEQIVVRGSGRVRGSISAPRIALDFGCRFSGAIDMDAVKDSAPATGDGKIADFKAAISGTGGASVKSAMGKSSAR
ncbi:MAG: polymer-forming cytoskeletal protein [Gammaproteobacteria bacterium]|nr:polymer-forming cytoskeletal protein [Gammaproteobacteria bacterium]